MARQRSRGITASPQVRVPPADILAYPLAGVVATGPAAVSWQDERAANLRPLVTVTEPPRSGDDACLESAGGRLPARERSMLSLSGVQAEVAT